MGLKNREITLLYIIFVKTISGDIRYGFGYGTWILNNVEDILFVVHAKENTVEYCVYQERDCLRKNYIPRLPF